MGGERRRQKSLRIGAQHANGVVWGPVYRTHLIRKPPPPRTTRVPSPTPRAVRPPRRCVVRSCETPFREAFQPRSTGARASSRTAARGDTRRGRREARTRPAARTPPPARARRAVGRGRARRRRRRARSTRQPRARGTRRRPPRTSFEGDDAAALPPRPRIVSVRARSGSARRVTSPPWFGRTPRAWDRSLARPPASRAARARACSTSSLSPRCRRTRRRRRYRARRRPRPRPNAARAR